MPPAPRRRFGVLGVTLGITVALVCLALAVALQNSPDILGGLPRPAVWVAGIVSAVGSTLLGTFIDRIVGWILHAIWPAPPDPPRRLSRVDDLPPAFDPFVNYRRERALARAVVRRAGSALRRGGWSGVVAVWKRRRESSGAAQVIVVTGGTGTGKTRLSLRIARDAADRFPDGVLWRDMYGDKHAATPASEETKAEPPALLSWIEPRRLWDWMKGWRSAPAEPDPSTPTGPRLGSVAPRTADNLLEGLLGSFEDSPRAPRSDLARAWRRLTSDKRLLLVLDNADDPAKVAQLIPSNPRCAVVVTCRGKAAGFPEGSTHIELEGFGVEDGVALLEEHAPVRGSRAEQRHERSQRREIVEHCRGLPQTLGMCGRWLADPAAPSTESLLGQLRGRGSNPLLRPGEMQGFAESFISVFHACGARERLLLWRLATTDLEEIADYAAAALLDVARGEARRSLEALERLFLLESLGHAEDGVHRFRLPRLVRAMLLANDPGQVFELPAEEVRAWGEEPTRHAMRRLVEAYTWMAEQAAQKLARPDGDFSLPRLDPLPAVDDRLGLQAPDHPRSWLAREREMLLGCCFIAQIDEHIQLGWRLARAVAQMCQVVRTHWHVWEQAVQAQCDLAAAGRDPLALGMALLDNSELTGNQGKYDLSVQHAQRAETLFTTTRADARWKARAWRALGVSQHRRGDLDTARGELTRAERVFAEHGARWWRARTRANIAELYSHLGRQTVAQDLLERARADFEREGDADQRDLVRLLLAEVLARRNRHLEAWLTLRDIRDRFARDGQQWYVARCLRTMGTLDSRELEAQFGQCDLAFNPRLRFELRSRVESDTAREIRAWGPPQEPEDNIRIKQRHWEALQGQARALLGDYAERARAEFDRPLPRWWRRASTQREWSPQARIAMLRTAISMLESMGDMWGVYRAQLTLASTLTRERRVGPEAVAAFASAADGFGELGDAWWQARVHRVAARELFTATRSADLRIGLSTVSLRARDWITHAREHAEKALGAYSARANHVGQIRSEILLARILWASGAPEGEVASHLRSAETKAADHDQDELGSEASALHTELFAVHPGDVARRWPIN